MTGAGVMTESSTGTGTIFVGAGEVHDSLPFRLSFRADNSSQRAFTVLLNVCNSEACSTNLHEGHKKGSEEFEVIWKAALERPAHPRCSHAWHIYNPSHSIAFYCIMTWRLCRSIKDDVLTDGTKDAG